MRKGARHCPFLWSAWQYDKSCLGKGEFVWVHSSEVQSLMVARVWENWYMAVTGSCKRNGETAAFLWVKTSACRMVQLTFRADFQPQFSSLEAPSQVCPMAYLLDYSRSCRGDKISCQKKLMKRTFQPPATSTMCISKGAMLLKITCKKIGDFVNVLWVWQIYYCSLL